VVLIEQTSGVAALERSGRLMKGNYAIAFVLYLLVSIIVFMVQCPAILVPVPLVAVAAQVTVNAVMSFFAVAARVIFYFSCRCRNENFDLTRLVEAVTRETLPQA
jgi:hypothetical protein